MTYIKWALCCVAIAALLAHRIIYFTPGTVDTFFSFCSYPVLVVQSRVMQPVRDFFQFRKSREQLEHQVTHLSEQYSALQQEHIQLLAQINYMHDVQELVDYKKRYQTDNALLAQVIQKSITPQEHYLFINAGSRKGVRQDMVAIFKNNLVGRVTQVFPWYSKVVLVTDQRCKVAAYCSKTKATGIFEGVNSSHAQLTHVSHLDTVHVGDLLLSSGEGLLFPQGFSLGTIEQVQPNGLSYDITIKPSIELADISYCYIMDKA